jgi:plastocyanin
MRRTGIFGALVMCVGVFVASSATIDVTADNDRNVGNRVVALRDDCDPRDTNWGATGGCNLPDGTVTEADFIAYLFSPLIATTVGHPSWAFDPTFVKSKAGKRISITNEGGRTHTFTEVADFGGGRVPPLNGVGVPGKVPLTPAAACVAPGVVNIPGGGKDETEELAAGDHKFQCCIHPWMRTLVRVTDED